jgi:hypothetical protein
LYKLRFDIITYYSYDANGNLGLDNNKAIGSIVYNHLNLPSVITVAGKGTITYTYDADGNKLRKVVAETGQPVKTTDYIAGFVYENNTLQFFGHEEGRSRRLTDGSFVFDFMLKDHLGNVRMVLTDEQQTVIYPAATLEGDININSSPNAVYKEKDYYTIAGSNIVTTPVPPNQGYENNNGIPNPNTYSNITAASGKMYRLNSSNKMGLGIALKVMAGDKIDILGKSYWVDNNTGGSGVNVAPAVLDLLNGLMGAPTGATAGGHTSASELNGIAGVNGPIGGFISQPDRDNPGYPQRPKAFINYIFLDEQFKKWTGEVDLALSVIRPV